MRDVRCYGIVPRCSIVGGVSADAGAEPKASLIKRGGGRPGVDLKIQNQKERRSE